MSMKAEDILKLVNAGYTKEEIAQMEEAEYIPKKEQKKEEQKAEQKKEEQKAEQKKEEQKAEQKKEQDPGIKDALNGYLTEFQRVIEESTKKLQDIAIKTDERPGGESKSSIDSFLASIIDPNIKGEEK